MQPITWSKEEFQASVAKKLAALKAVRASAGTSFKERLALAEDRLAFEEATAGAAMHTAACSAGLVRKAGPCALPKWQGDVMSNDSLGAMAFSRIIDPSDEGADESTRHTSYTAADDSYGAHSNGSGANDVGPDPESDSASTDEDEIAAAQASQRRLLEANLRQTSPDWVVLDRASVLHKLQGHPQGLTLVRLAELLLGGNASPRDTRRLSAMMKREETRETVTRAGRGQPIKLTDEGVQELQKLDVATESKKSIEERQRRVRGQQERLKSALGGQLKIKDKE
jgi:hypothetical protein